MKTMFSVFKIILLGLAILVCSVSVLLLIFVSFSPIKTFQIFRVMSGSMEPAIKTGSIVLVKQIGSQELRINDIITFSTKNALIPTTHRIFGINNDGNEIKIITKGDVNRTSDPNQIGFADIRGKVIISIPYFGYISVWTKTPWGFAFLIILPAILIIINEIFNIKGAVKDEIKKKISETKLPPTPILLLIGSILAFALFIKPTSAIFSDGKVLSGNIFSTGNWSTPSLTPTPTLTPDPTLTPTPLATPTASPIPTLSATPTPTPDLTNIANHVVISEIQIAGATADDEFVEIYNPTSLSINLSTLPLKLHLISGTGTDANRVITFTNSTIPAHGFFLIGPSTGYTRSTTLDATYASSGTKIVNDGAVYISTSTADKTGLIDLVGFGTASSSGREGTALANPPANNSVERKAFSTSDVTSMTSGADALKGNGYDSNNNASDFILRSVSQPQNSSSAPEGL
jgi:signal peptidase I